MNYWNRLIRFFSEIIPGFGGRTKRAKKSNTTNGAKKEPVSKKKEVGPGKESSENDPNNQLKSNRSGRLMRFDQEIKSYQKQIEKAVKKNLSFPEIPSELLLRLQKELIDDHVEAEGSDGQKKRDRKLKDFESSHRAINKQLKLLQEYSLVNIKSQRIEREKIILQEKLAKERLQLIEKAFNKINTAIKDSAFELAKELIALALSDFPEKKAKLQKIQESIVEREIEWEQKKEKFLKILSDGEDYVRKGEYTNALVKYEQAKILNFNNALVDEKIAVVNQKITAQQKLQAKKELKEKEQLKYKVDQDRIQQILRKHDIRCFYHYTDSANINSIIQNAGIFSLNMLKKKNIDFVRGSETGEKPDYVRLSYCSWHPLMHKSLKQGRIRRPITLEVDTAVSSLRATRFTNVNAARTSSPPVVKFGDDAEFLAKEVRFNVVKGRYAKAWSTSDKAYYQAEVMVKDSVEYKYIKNI